MKNHAALRFFLLVWLAGFSLSVQAADRLQEFPLQVPLRLEDEGPWYRLKLPMSVQLASRHADLRDLRVFNAAGETLAYALVASQAGRENTLETHKVRSFPLYADASNDRAPAGVDVRVRRDVDGTLVEVTTELQDQIPSRDKIRRGWLLDCSGIDRPLERLVLNWDGVEGFQRFTIEASDDLERWRSWGEGGVARLRFAADRIERREVRLPGRQANYLRLLWKQPYQAPELAEVLLQSSTTNQRPTPIIWTDPLAARQISEYAYVWELPLALPVIRLRMPMQQNNRLLPVTLQSRIDPKQKWQPLSRGLLYRVDQQNEVLLQHELDLPDWSRFKELKLTVDPRGGGLGGQLPALQFGLRGTELVFLARGEQPYTLAVGKPDVQSAQLPLATLMPGMQDQNIDGLPQVKLIWTDAETMTMSPATATPSHWDWKRIGLWVVLLLGVGLLVLMAWSLLRSSKAKT
ncbi:MAG: DUF3999 domain-containing protein [Chromatiales bacterium]|jgi:hypothetical protein